MSTLIWAEPKCFYTLNNTKKMYCLKIQDKKKLVKDYLDKSNQ